MLEPAISDERPAREPPPDWKFEEPQKVWTWELTPHPANEEIYGKEELDPDFIKSIEEKGILEPLVIYRRAPFDYLIISGHRRWRAANAIGIGLVPVLVYGFDMADSDQVAELIHRNKQREKTKEQRAREFEKLAAANAIIAQERMMEGVKGDDPLGNFPEGSICSKDVAAKAVGMSRKTAEKAAAVVHKIDELEASGEKAKAAELKKTLNNKSVSAAHAKATAGRKPKKNPKIKTVKRNAKLEYDDSVLDSYYGHLFREIDERGKILKCKESTEHKAVVKSMHELADNLKALKEGRT